MEKGRLRNNMKVARKELWKKFWKQFNNAVAQKNVSFEMQKVWDNNYYLIKLGVSRCYIGIDLIQRENRIRFGLYTQDKISIYEKLEQHKEKINKEAGLPLEWSKMKNSGAARACIYLNSFNLYDEESYSNFIEKLINYADVLTPVLKKYLI